MSTKLDNGDDIGKDMNRIDCFSPNNGHLLDSVPVTTNAEIARVLERLQDHVVRWEERVVVLRTLSESIRAAKEVFARIIIDEVGKTLEEAHGEVDYACTFLDAAASWVDTASRDGVPSGTTGVLSVPVGLALLVTPYNDPLAGITRKIASAIAAGCPVIVKPSPLGALCAQRLRQVLPAEAVPHAHFVFLEDHEQIARLVRENTVAIVSMTGSTVAGRAIATVAASRPIPAVLELGGICPFVVLPDCDLQRAARDLLDRKIRAAGQACSSVNCVLVHGQVYHRFCEEVSGLLPTYICGRSDSEGVQYGPVRTRGALARLDALEQRCLSDGSTLLFRGPLKAGSEKSYCRPLSVLVANQANALDTEETFGPLLVIQRFRDEAQIAAALLRNRQKLVAYFYGASASHFLSAYPALRFGSIGINTTRIQGPAVPTGGFGDAGYGREGGFWGIEEFRTTINIRVQ